MGLKDIVLAAISSSLIGTAGCEQWKEKSELISEHEKEITQMTEEHNFLNFTIEDLQNETFYLTKLNDSCEIRLADSQFRMQQIVNQCPNYDIKRFLKFNPQAEQFFPQIIDATMHYNNIWPVDLMFALGILKQETDFSKNIVSPAGALGPWQFIESTARKYGLKTNEPMYWKQARANYAAASKKKQEASTLLSKILTALPQGVDPNDTTKNRLAKNLERNVREFERYYALIDEFKRAETQRDEAWKKYRDEIREVYAGVPEVVRQVKDKQRYDDELSKAMGTKPKTKEEKEWEIKVGVDKYLANYDERLCPIKATYAAIHLIADLAKYHSGDLRLAASNYNASDRLLWLAGNGIIPGIPTNSETAPYVNAVISFAAKFRVQAGVDENYYYLTSNYSEYDGTDSQ